MVTNKDTLSPTKAEILASDLHQRIEADNHQRDTCQRLATHLADLVQDMMISNTNPEPIDYNALAFLNKHACHNWADMDNMIRRLEAEAHVESHAGKEEPHRMAAGLDFQLLDTSDQQSPSRPVNTRQTNSWSPPAWAQHQQNLTNYIPQVVGPDVVPYNGQEKRTFDEFLRDFGWRYGLFTEHVQRSCLVNLLRGYALDVFNSLEPEVQNGPLLTVLDQMRARLSTVDQVPLNTLHAQLLRCRREPNQSITAYIVKLDLLAGQLYQPNADHEKDYVEIGKANALLENINEPELMTDIDKILSTATPREVFKEARDCALRYERLKLRRKNDSPPKQYSAPPTIQRSPPAPQYPNKFTGNRPPHNSRNGMAKSILKEGEVDPDNTDDTPEDNPGEVAPSFAITSRGPASPTPEEETDAVASLTQSGLNPSSLVPSHAFGLNSPWLDHSNRRSTLDHFRLNMAHRPSGNSSHAPFNP